MKMRAARRSPSVGGPSATSRILSLFLGLAMLFAGALTIPSTGAATETAQESETLLASDGEAKAELGDAVAVDGDTALVGAPLDDNANGGKAGAAYVFNRTGTGVWDEQTQLIASDGDSNDQFGHAVALDGDTALVGAPKASKAYVFVRTGPGTWAEQAKLTATDTKPADRFGWSVALDGDRALIGARTADNADRDNSGAAYVFVRSETGTWSEQAKLFAEEGTGGDLFGSAVALDGDTALIGARADKEAGGGKAGAAYVFTFNATGAWSQKAKFLASDGAEGDQFGWDVALENATALIGARSDDNENGADAGAAYVFVRTGTGWEEQAKLTASDGGDQDSFGASVALDGDGALIGVDSAKNATGTATGAAYAFHRSAPGTWDQQVKLTASDGQDGDQLGWSVALDWDTALVGAPLDDNVKGGDAGSAYVFALSLRDLRASPGSEIGEIELDWRPPAAATSPITYTVKRANSTGGPYEPIANTSGLNYTDTGLSNQTFYYVVTAQDASGHVSEPSNEASTQPLPPPPENLTAREGDDEGEVHLDWDRPANTTATFSYRVYRSTQDGGPYEFVDNRTNTTYNDSGRDPDTYYYVVTAVGQSGVESSLSEQASVQVTGTSADSSDPEDETQNDAGTGGDASDDPDDPTVLAGGEVIHINGTLAPGRDPVDVYGTRISPDATVSMLFNFSSPVGMGLNLTLLAPNGTAVDTHQAPVSGGPAVVEATAPSGGHLLDGIWVTVLEHGGTRTDGALLLDPRPNTDHVGVLNYQDERRCDPHC